MKSYKYTYVASLFPNKDKEQAKQIPLQGNICLDPAYISDKKRKEILKALTEGKSIYMSMTKAVSKDKKKEFYRLSLGNILEN